MFQLVTGSLQISLDQEEVYPQEHQTDLADPGTYSSLIG